MRSAGKKPKFEQTASPPSSSPLQGSGSDRAEQSNTCTLHIGERLCKLEQLFERFVCRKTSTVAPSTSVPRSPTLVGLSDKDSNFGLPKIPSDAQSILSLGDGIVSSCFSFCGNRLTCVARCTDVDFSAVCPHTGRQARQHKALKRRCHTALFGGSATFTA